MNKVFSLFLFFCLFSYSAVFSQVLTSEDSLSAGVISSTQKTIVSGYGEAKVSIDIKAKDAEATLERAVLFLGHKFSNRISLFTEMEIEDAMVVGGISSNGEEKGEIAMEQAFLKFDLNANHYVEAGLIIPRIGIINENHLPTTFNGIERPHVEQLIIPSTWRGIGVGYYGSSIKINGLNYSASLTNGLNSAKFENGSGIVEGRQQGAMAKGLGLMTNVALLYYFKNLRIQISSTISGSTAVEKSVADSLHLHNGAFANPVFIHEMNVQYQHDGIECRVLACIINIPNVDNINQVYANSTPYRMAGAYTELGYNFLYKRKKENKRSLILFSRAEYLNLNWKMAENGITNNENEKIYLITGITYKPVRGVAIKFDYTEQWAKTAAGFINFGIGYNF